MLFKKDTPLSKQANFEKILDNYQPSNSTIDTLNDGPLVLLVAPAAAGRNTIIRNLIMTGKYRFLVSDTTRKPRMNNGVLEHSGSEYWFRSEQELIDELKRGEYAGPAIIHNQQVSAISAHEIAEAHAAGKTPITDIEIKGCDNIVKIKADAHCIFVLPPSFSEWMRRMDGRGAMPLDEKRRRLESSVQEISTALSRHYFEYIINWDLRGACQRIHELVVQSNFIEQAEQQLAEQHARQLLADIEAWLKDN